MTTRIRKAPVRLEEEHAIVSKKRRPTKNKSIPTPPRKKHSKASALDVIQRDEPKPRKRAQRIPRDPLAPLGKIDEAFTRFSF